MGSRIIVHTAQKYMPKAAGVTRLVPIWEIGLSLHAWLAEGTRGQTFRPQSRREMRTGIFFRNRAAEMIAGQAIFLPIAFFKIIRKLAGLPLNCSFKQIHFKNASDRVLGAV